MTTTQIFCGLIERLRIGQPDIAIVEPPPPPPPPQTGEAWSDGTYFTDLTGWTD